MEEIWKDIEGYEGLYQVSSLGRVKRLCKPKYGDHILKGAPDRNGYLRVRLYRNGEGSSIYIHQLVAKAFVPNPRGLNTVSHLDETRDNNVASNLAWATQKENANMPMFKKRLSERLKKDLIEGDIRNKHIAALSKAWRKGADNHSSKSVVQFDVNGNIIAEYPSQLEASKKTGISNNRISSCCLGNNKTAGGFIWKFKTKD